MSVKQNDNELIVALEALPEKTQEIVRTLSVLKRAKQKRERRQMRNLNLKANGGFNVLTRQS